MIDGKPIQTFAEWWKTVDKIYLEEQKPLIHLGWCRGSQAASETIKALRIQLEDKK